MPTTIIKSVSKSQGTLKPLTGRIGVLAERFPNRVAIATKDSEVTYSQLWKNSEAFAKAMLEDIESPGRSPRVVLMLNDACDQACAYIGLMRAGVTAVLVEAMFRGPPLNKLSHIEGVPYDYEGADRETRIGRNLNEGHVSEVVNITGAVDVVKPQRFTALLERGRTLDTIPLPTERDPGVVLLTAGTTGTPKLVEHSAEGVFAAFEMFLRFYSRGTASSENGWTPSLVPASRNMAGGDRSQSVADEPVGQWSGGAFAVDASSAGWRNICRRSRDPCDGTA
jgi:acyl-CoA synthetase (AMP-forming)/AMP-acid ligase II